MDARPAMQALMALDEPEVVPALEYQSVQEQPLTNTRLVHFQQSHASIPVFGSSVIVELTPDRGLIAIDAELADPSGACRGFSYGGAESPAGTRTDRCSLQRGSVHIGDG